MIRRRIMITVTSLLAIAMLVFFSVFIFRGGIIFGSLFNPRIDQRQMERILGEDYYLLTEVIDYLVDSGHSSLNLFPRRGNEFLSVFSDDFGMQHILITDDSVISSIDTLRARGYGVIRKSHNTVQFLRWSARNRGHGIAYSTDGNSPNSHAFSFLTTLKPFSIDGWFYFEENFSEYRGRQ